MARDHGEVEDQSDAEDAEEKERSGDMDCEFADNVSETRRRNWFQEIELRRNQECKQIP